MNQITYIDAAFLNKHTDYLELIEELDIAFSKKEIQVPPRKHYDIENKTEESNTLLLMPCWESCKDIGIKIVNVQPQNNSRGLSTIQGSYLYMDAKTGILKSIIEAPTLTNKRTAAASALASKYLSLETASTLLVLGTGSLAPELIKAHVSVRPIEQVYVWGRNSKKAEAVAKAFEGSSYTVTAIEKVQDVIENANIISCATSSHDPILLGDWLREGQHVDLVGSYKPNMREADDDVMIRGKIYVDTMEMAPKESGDLFIPLQNNVINRESVQGDLFDLCSKKIEGRKSPEEITVFKSVGIAIEDLVAARYYYKKYKQFEKHIS